MRDGEVEVFAEGRPHAPIGADGFLGRGIRVEHRLALILSTQVIECTAELSKGGAPEIFRFLDRMCATNELFPWRVCPGAWRRGNLRPRRSYRRSGSRREGLHRTPPGSMVPSHIFTWRFIVRAPMQKRIQSNNAGRIASPWSPQTFSILPLAVCRLRRPPRVRF